jgi:UDP-N-acetylmuramyl pentapeptide phosphotransferase/UDP-N-acetylglucosamine-1-phosphate transferase
MSEAAMRSLSPASIAACCCLAAFLVAVVVVRITIAYAHRRGMLDEPGRRRSHSIPTPRGGGLGVILGALAGMLPALVLLPESLPAILVSTLLLAVVGVAAVGWWDDHGSLPVLPRLLVQLAAAGLFSAALVVCGVHWLWWPPLLLAGVWAINLHNFMDGIDGLLAQQTIFIGLALGVLAYASGLMALSAASVALAAAAAGFWLFNRSPARIFMGDVGSGTLGLLVFMLTALLWRSQDALLWPALMFSSAFAIDATLTLLQRMVGGRRWYTPHREHLYQWMVRRGGTHAWVGRRYAAWNVLVCLPVAWLAFEYPTVAPLLCVALYLAAGALWWKARRWCLRRDRGKAKAR